jgi:hypothetical protein
LLRLPNSEATCPIVAVRPQRLRLALALLALLAGPTSLLAFLLSFLGHRFGEAEQRERSAEQAAQRSSAIYGGNEGFGDSIEAVDVHGQAPWCEVADVLEASPL